jgi:hypothetical protein
MTEGVDTLWDGREQNLLPLDQVDRIFVFWQCSQTLRDIAVMT